MRFFLVFIVAVFSKNVSRGAPDPLKSPYVLDANGTPWHREPSQSLAVCGRVHAKDPYLLHRRYKPSTCTQLEHNLEFYARGKNRKVYLAEVKDIINYS